MARKSFNPISLKKKKKIISFFTSQHIDVGDENGDFIYNGLDDLKRFSLFIDNPKGRFGSFLGLRYKRKPMLVAYIHFVTEQDCGLYINGVKNVEWGKQKQKDLEKKFALDVNVACLSVKPIFKKKKLDLLRLR